MELTSDVRSLNDQSRHGTCVQPYWNACEDLFEDIQSGNQKVRLQLSLHPTIGQAFTSLVHQRQIGTMLSDPTREIATQSK